MHVYAQMGLDEDARVCVCPYACMKGCMYICMYSGRHHVRVLGQEVMFMQTYQHHFLHVFGGACMHTNTRTRTHTQTHAISFLEAMIYTYMHACMHACMHVYMYMSVCMYVRMRFLN
jgi:hypothetical protein